MKNKKIITKRFNEAFDETEYRKKYINEQNMIIDPAISNIQDLVAELTTSSNKLNDLLKTKGINHKVRLSYDDKRKRIIMESEKITGEFGIFNDAIESAYYHSFGGGNINSLEHDGKFYFNPTVWFNFNLAYQSKSGGTNGLNVVLETGPHGWTSSSIYFDLRTLEYTIPTYRTKMGDIEPEKTETPENSETADTVKENTNTKPTAKELYDIFNKINKDIVAEEGEDGFVSLADIEYYTDQIQNIYELPEAEAKELAKEIAAMSKVDEVRKPFRHPRGWAILPAGTIKLDSGNSTYFNVIENNGDTTGTLYLVEKSNGNYHIFSSAEDYKETSRIHAGKHQDCFHDQTLKPYTVKVVDTYPATLEGLAKIKELTGKKSLPFSVFK